ncbi:MAG: acyltransferase, partial [Acidobacteriota bacterium]
MVLWAHQGNIFYSTPEAYLQGGLFYFGRWGVPVFFGLSGLLITKLLLEENDRRGSISLKAFYIRRCFRILPPMLLYLAVVQVAGLLQSTSEFWSCIFFFRNYLPWQQGSWYSGHLWSLSVEEHFYLFWPTVLVMTGVRRAWIPAVGLSLLSALWRGWNLFPGNESRTDLHLDRLLLGAALAFLL